MYWRRKSLFLLPFLLQTQKHQFPLRILIPRHLLFFFNFFSCLFSRVFTRSGFSVFLLIHVMWNFIANTVDRSQDVIKHSTAPFVAFILWLLSLNKKLYWSIEIKLRCKTFDFVLFPTAGSLISSRWSTD